MIKGLYEAHLPVQHLDVSVAFYSGLGLKLAWRDEDTAFFWIEEGKSWLGLWQGEAPLTPYHPSLRHVAFRVTYADLKKALGWLASIGAEAVPLGRRTSVQPFIRPNQGNASVYFDDPDGNSLELMCAVDVPDELKKITEKLSFGEWESLLKKRRLTETEAGQETDFIAQEEHLDEGRRRQLARLLVEVVADGASVGFLPPLAEAEADAYWHNVPAANVRLWTACLDGEIVGSVQLHLAEKANGLHRAEIAKLMVHPGARRRGLARKLIETAENAARAEGRSLLVLDTREGDPSNRLYRSLGYEEAGRIPDYARSEDGRLDATVLYFKRL